MYLSSGAEGQPAVTGMKPPPPWTNSSKKLTVSGMVFQDAWNLDLDRLRRCYICEVDTARGMVPFCAYNLTDINGRALYRT